MCLRELQIGAFGKSKMTEVKFPYVSDLIDYQTFSTEYEKGTKIDFTITFPPNMTTKTYRDDIISVSKPTKIIIPRSSLHIIAKLSLSDNSVIEIIEDADNN